MFDGPFSLKACQEGKWPAVRHAEEVQLALHVYKAPGGVFHCVQNNPKILLLLFKRMTSLLVIPLSLQYKKCFQDIYTEVLQVI